MSLSELIKILQDIGVVVIIVLLAYVVYKIGVLVDTISDKMKS
ncbi:MAG: hypothetical protein QW146_07755 [Candidatus Bathyarchaeia archaeon]